MSIDMQNPTLFFSSAELITKFGDETDRLYIKRNFEVKKLDEQETKKTIYDSDLKLYFEDKSIVTYLFEINIKEIDVAASEYLSKSVDYLRRICYRHDWLQVLIDTEGKNCSIKNNEELKNTWGKLKSKIRKTYTGSKIEKHLSEIDLEFDMEKSALPAMYQYTCYGLLFPGIPQIHSPNWKHEREIELSEYEKETFVEKTEFVKVDEEGTREYQVLGESKPDCRYTLNRYNGIIRIPHNKLLPTHSEVVVEFQREDVANKWYFKLIQY